MLPLNFYLRSKGGVTQTIYLFATFGKERIKFSTKEKINPKHWNSNIQRAAETRSNLENINLNNRLKQIKIDLEALIRDAENRKIKLTPELVKDLVNNYFNPQPEVEPEPTVNFFAEIENFIATSKNSKTPNTIKSYVSALNHLRSYAAHSKTEIYFESIDLKFYDRFTNYLINKLGHSKNTVGKYIKILKTFMSEAAARKLHTNFEFKEKEFKVTSETVDSIYLTLEELETLFNLDLQENPKLDKVRDLLLIGCYTGLRFSDFSRLTAENIQGNTISIRTQKTSMPVVVPIRAEVMEILRKYKGELPRAYSNQKTNEYLKELGRLAAIDATFRTTRTRGAHKVHTTRQKYELITTHTARRSFATNAFLNDVSTLAIMKITGHTTETSFMKYIKMSAEDNARKLQQHPFFNNTLPIAKLKAVS